MLNTLAERNIRWLEDIDVYKRQGFKYGMYYIWLWLMVL